MRLAFCSSLSLPAFPHTHPLPHSSCLPHRDWGEGGGRSWGLKDQKPHSTLYLKVALAWGSCAAHVPLLLLLQHDAGDSGLLGTASWSCAR